MIVKRIRKSVSDVEASYMAGFFDGEGSISAFKQKRDGKNRTIVHSSISQIDARPLMIFREKYGGKIYRYEPTKRFANAKPYYMWACRGPQLEWMLEDMLPYLVLKKDQAEQALSIRKLMKRKGWGPSRYSDGERTSLDAAVFQFKRA